MGIITKLFAGTIVAKTVGPLFAWLKGKKTWFGLVGMAAISVSETMFVIPGYLKPILDQVFIGLSGATVVSGGDKIRRIWETTKKVGDAAVSVVPQESAQPPK